MVVLRNLVFLLVVGGAMTLTAADSSTPAFSFRQVEYFHRWSQATQHEFTPAKQEDLEHWTDMITINAYPGVDEGEKMAGTANAVLGNYKSHKGKVLRTNSVPATDERPAEHFISVLFTRPDFAEAAFARFKLIDGKGHSFVYSRRFYGDKAGDEMSEWLKTNGEKIEKALMEWNPPGSALSGR
jgi:hypothetical protein